jgi:hypothetical protein
MIKLLLRTILFVALMGCTMGATTTTESNLSKAWKLDLKNVSIDPSSWGDEITSKMQKVGAGVAYGATLGLPVVHLIAFAVLLFGLVKLSWPLVISCCVGLYGWRTGKKTFLLVGAGISYALAFGVSLL